jgi:hypothetical protein
MAQHGPQRDQPGAARHEQKRAAVSHAPREVASDRAAQLELVAGAELVGEVGRHLAVVDALHGQSEIGVLRSRGDRVGALGLVAVVGGETHVNVLARHVAGPARHVEHDRRRALGLGLAAAHRGDPPDDCARAPRQSLQ